MEGLYGKYKITKADGSEVDPEADYFVLRLDKDPAARAAIFKYASYTENQELAEDLLKRVDKYMHLDVSRHFEKKETR